jgi:hypothetical protein
MNGPGTHSRGDTADAFFGCSWADGTICPEPAGGSGTAGGVRADVSSLARSASRGRRARVAGPSPATVTAPRAGAGDRADAGSVSRALPRVHGEAFPRAVGQAAQLRAGLHSDQAASASVGSGDAGEDAVGASQEAAAASDGGHDAASGRLDARLAARRRRQARPGGDDGGCHRRAVFGVPGG